MNTMTLEQAQAQIAALEAKLAQTKADAQRKLSCKVSEKGAISVYGLGRFPVTLYVGQWERLIDFVKSGAIDRFAIANKALLSVKE